MLPQSSAPTGGSAGGNNVPLDDRVSGVTEQGVAANERAAIEAEKAEAEAEHDRKYGPTKEEKGKALNGHGVANGDSITNGSDDSVNGASAAPKKRLASHMSSTAAPPPAPESPEVKASALNKLFFWWLNKIMHKGSRAALEFEDLYEVNPDVDAAYCSQLFEAQWQVELKRQAGDPSYQPSVQNALYRIFKFEFWVGAITKCFMDGLQFFQPILLEWLLVFIGDSWAASEDPADFSQPAEWKGYVLAAAIGLCPFLTSVLMNYYFRVMMTIGLRTRTILTTALYKKALRLSPAARQTMSVGQIVNMMSTDATKIDLFCGYIHYLWSAMEQVIVAIALLIRALGPAALAGVAVVLVMLPFQGFVMQHLQRIRKATVKYTDSRVKLMNEILQGIRVIKVYAWEIPFMQKLGDIRGEEVRFVRKMAYTRAWNFTLMQAGPILMCLLAFLTVALTQDTFKAQYVFSSLVLFNLLRMPLMLFPMTLAFFSDARIGVKRIQAFLLAEELSSAPEYVEADKVDFAIKVENATFAWEKAVAEKTEKGLTIKQAAASGKKKDEAKAQSAATSSSSSSTAAKPGNVKDAAAPAGKEDVKLLLSSPASPSAAADSSSSSSSSDDDSEPFRLDDVDLTIPKGSLTVIVGGVGSGKSSLLAGLLGEMKREKGNVKIAGAVGYCPQQAWIQNATLRENITFGLPFDEKKYEDAIKYSCLQADIDVLPAKDHTEIGEKGINLSGGQKQRVNLARAVYYDASIVLLDDPLSAVDAHVSKTLFNECICKKLKDKTRVLVTHQLQYVSSCDRVFYVSGGKVAEQGTYQELMAKQGEFYTLMSTYVGEEEEEEEEEEVDEAEPASSGVSGESVVSSGMGVVLTTSKPRRKKGLRTKKASAGGRKSSAGAFESKVELTVEEKLKKAEERNAARALMQAEERTKGGVPLDVYLYYMKQCGGAKIMLPAFFFMCLQTATNSYNTWWLGLWTDNEYGRSNEFYLGVYAGLGGAQVVWTFLAISSAAYMGVRAAAKLHQQSFSSVLKAPMSFFETTPIGRIINRFSKDQDVIDSMLMDVVRMVVFMLLIVTATFVMIMIVTPWFFIPLIPILAIYWYVQRDYRNSSRELKRLDSISRSPLFAHFSETLTGLSTIRAYRAQDTFTRVNEQRMDGNNRPYYLLVLTQRWLSIRVETIGSLVAFFAALIIVIQRKTLNPGESGVSLTYAIGVTSLLNWVVRQTVEAENAMNAVERSKFYTDGIPHEAAAEVPEEDSKLTESWPQRGTIDFKDLKIRYRPGLPLVLHGITLNVRGGERVGIVGRTGAGKSSLMVALFRIVESAGGSILIDGVDISKLGLKKLRSKLAIIPQDPVLYSGTVRSNLDPFDEHTDAELWSALEKAYLKDTIAALNLKLQETVTENGDNFSVGQRCQMCLARALLKNARILIMDEATASVDMETDSKIQSSLRRNFNGTVLTIAHRLNTIVDFDRVLVLDFGRVREFDTPANLLRNADSLFSAMVDETGETQAATLRNIAFKAEQGITVDVNDLLALDAPADEDGKQPATGHRNRNSFTQTLQEPSHVVFHTEEDADL